MTMICTCDAMYVPFQSVMRITGIMTPEQEVRMAEAQAAQKKKRGFGRLMSAVTRTATQSGDYAVAQTANDIYSANATAEDLSAAAKDLGLTEDEVAACQNP